VLQTTSTGTRHNGKLWGKPSKGRASSRDLMALP
jgi:hypothetical protein